MIFVILFNLILLEYFLYYQFKYILNIYFIIKANPQDPKFKSKLKSTVEINDDEEEALSIEGIGSLKLLYIDNIIYQSMAKK